MGIYGAGVSNGNFVGGIKEKCRMQNDTKDKVAGIPEQELQRIKDMLLFYNTEKQETLTGGSFLSIICCSDT